MADPNTPLDPPGLYFSPESVAVVTGGGSGIGRAICVQLARLGVPVGALDLDGDGAKETAQIVVDGGGRAIGIGSDVTDPGNTQQAVDDVSRELGHAANLVVHNAGWTGPNVPFLEFPDEERRRVIDVNYGGALNIVAATAPGMIDRGVGGSYVFVSSDAARIGTPKEAVYSGAKAAIIAYCKAMTIELAPHDIRLNVVSPGSTDTPLIRKILSQEQIDRRVRANPMRRMGTPQDVAFATTFLLSTGAGYVSGQVLSVNGGMTRVD